MSICRSRRAVVGALSLLSLSVLSIRALEAQPTPVVVFAASSLTDTMKEIAAAYKAKTGITVTLSFGASSTLAHQIDQGAPAEIFISADSDWMDFLQKNGRITPATRKDLLGNQLVLVAAKGSHPIRISPGFDLAGALGDGKLALADPNSVPAGKYGKASLTALGVWDSVSGKIANAENVRVALEYVARGETPYGIVYATDAKVSPDVTVGGVFPPTTHPPIVYPVALTQQATPAAQVFLSYLSGPEARRVFEKAGFTRP